MNVGFEFYEILVSYSQHSMAVVNTLSVPSENFGIAHPFLSRKRIRTLHFPLNSCDRGLVVREFRPEAQPEASSSINVHSSNIRATYPQI